MTGALAERGSAGGGAGALHATAGALCAVRRRVETCEAADPSDKPRRIATDLVGGLCRRVKRRTGRLCGTGLSFPVARGCAWWR